MRTLEGGQLPLLLVDATEPRDGLLAGRLYCAPVGQLLLDNEAVGSFACSHTLTGCFSNVFVCILNINLRLMLR